MNLITNGDHKPRAKPQSRNGNGSQLTQAELDAEENRRFHEMQKAKAAK